MISNVTECLGTPALGQILAITAMFLKMLPLYPYMEQKLNFVQKFQIVDFISVEMNQIKL